MGAALAILAESTYGVTVSFSFRPKNWASWVDCPTLSCPSRAVCIAASDAGCAAIFLLFRRFLGSLQYTYLLLGGPDELLSYRCHHFHKLLALEEENLIVE